jgi:hypothetical protein
MEAFFDNLSEAPRKGKARGFTFYLDKIKELGLEFDKLEAFCTDGDIRPPYPYQWRATTKVRPGEDDPFEGIASEPLEALHLLWKQVKTFLKTPDTGDYDDDSGMADSSF